MGKLTVMNGTVSSAVTSFPVSFFAASAVHPPVRQKDKNPYIPKYWNVPGRIFLKHLNMIANNGMESVHNMDILWGYDIESMSPGGKNHGDCLK